MHAIELKEENVELVKLLLDAGATINYGKEVKTMYHQLIETDGFRNLYGQIICECTVCY